MSIDKTTLHNDIQRFEENRQNEYRTLNEQWINFFKEIHNNKSDDEPVKLE